jgi:ribosomal protein L37AE/L43A
MKSVKPERLNREYACPECEGFLAVFGNKKNDEWVCIDCETFFTGGQLEERALRLFRVEKILCDTECGEVGG